MIAGDELSEEFAFAPQPFLKGQDDGVAHGFDAGDRRLSAMQPPGQRLGRIGKPLRRELLVTVADKL